MDGFAKCPHCGRELVAGEGWQGAGASGLHERGGSDLYPTGAECCEAIKQGRHSMVCATCGKAIEKDKSYVVRAVRRDAYGTECLDCCFKRFGQEARKTHGNRG